MPDRSFTSFSQAAQESADSRLYGGIHWRFDNEDGLTAGEKLGEIRRQKLLPEDKRQRDGKHRRRFASSPGLGKSDNISLIREFDQLVVFSRGRKIGRFELASLDAIEIDARGGNDIMPPSATTSISATIHGGDGNDSLFGGGMPMISCSAIAATTGSLAAWATTCSTAATGTTCSGVAPATTRSSIRSADGSGLGSTHFKRQ